MDNKTKEEPLIILQANSNQLSSKHHSQVLSSESSKGVVAIPMKIIKKPSRHKENAFDLIPEQIIKKGISIEDSSITIPLQMENKSIQNTKRESPKPSPRSQKQKLKLTEETTAAKLINNKELNKIRQYMEMSSSSKKKSFKPKYHNRHLLSVTEYDDYSNTNWQRINVNNSLNESPANKHSSITESNNTESVYSPMKLTKRQKILPSPKHKATTSPSVPSESVSVPVKQYKKKITPNLSMNTKKESNISRNSIKNICIEKDKDKNEEKHEERMQRIKRDNSERSDSMQIINDIKTNDCFLTFRALSPNIEDKNKEDIIDDQHILQYNNTYPTTQTNDQSQSKHIDSLANYNDQLVNSIQKDAVIQSKDEKINGCPIHHDNSSNDNKGDKSNVLETSNKDIQLKDRPTSLNSALFFRDSEKMNGLSLDNNDNQLELQIDNCTNCYFINKTNIKLQSAHSFVSENVSSINHSNYPKMYLQFLERINSATFSIIRKHNNREQEERNSNTNNNKEKDKAISLSNYTYQNEQELTFNNLNDSSNKEVAQLQSSGFDIIPKIKPKDNIISSNINYNHIPRRYQIIFDFERNKNKVSIRDSTENIAIFSQNNTNANTNNNNKNSSSFAKVQFEMNLNQSTNSIDDMFIRKKYNFNKNDNNSKGKNKSSKCDCNCNARHDNYIKSHLHTFSQSTESDIRKIPKISYNQLFYKKKVFNKQSTDINELHEKLFEYPITLTKNNTSASKYYLLSTENRSLDLKLCGHIDFDSKNNNLTCRQCLNEINNRKKITRKKKPSVALKKKNKVSKKSK